MNFMFESKNGVYKSWSLFYQQTKSDGLIRKGMDFPRLSHLLPLPHLQVPQAQPVISGQAGIFRARTSFAIKILP